MVGGGDDGGGGGKVDGWAAIDVETLEEKQTLLHGAAALGIGSVDGVLSLGGWKGRDEGGE